MFTLENRHLFQCSESEKLECVESVKIIIHLANVARRLGVLALEYSAKKKCGPFLSRGISLICDGTEPKLVTEIMRNYIISSGDTGKALLEKYVLMRGVLLVQEGANPIIIAEILLGIIGITDWEGLDLFSEAL